MKSITPDSRQLQATPFKMNNNFNPSKKLNKNMTVQEVKKKRINAL